MAAVTAVPESVLKVTVRAIASQPAKSWMSDVGAYLAPASPILVRVTVLVESYQPVKVNPVLVSAPGRSSSPDVVPLAVAGTAEPPFEL